MSIFTGFNIAASGMTAQQTRSDIIAQNIANVNTTRTQDGTPYVRKNVYFTEKTVNHAQAFQSVLKAANQSVAGNGVKITAIVNDTDAEMKMVYDPSHPDADENGYVTYPNVDVVTEMTDLIDATRAYEANVTAFNATKNMLTTGLKVGQS
ncbi:MAG: flagellar basal body rod protein FlgC [Lachnospiraceae bacterium]|nr:flagellar basal body rod protein FlgC [Lachnospiraceae bacterium]